MEDGDGQGSRERLQHLAGRLWRGTGQSLENPLGSGGEDAARVVLPHPDLPADATATRAARPASTTISRRSFDGNLGAWIMGRNMFGPGPRRLARRDWKGWWGEDPPYHVPGLRADPPCAAAAGDGGRDGVPLRHRRHRGGAGPGARAAAGDKDIRIGGGAATIRQYLEAGLIDEMHLGDLAGPARPRRAFAGRARSAGDGL